jgi:peptidoglycan hydrolase-like protein with peptidoglycan-binding domain
VVIDLTGSVGNGGANNRSDVKKVQERLHSLGFTFVGVADGDVGPKTILAIKLFQSIKNGKQKLEGDGRVDLDGDTHKWLQAENAPRWQQMTEMGDGFVNIEIADTADDHDYGTDWLDETLKSAAAKYKTDYLDANSANLLTINDTSKPQGGNTPDHAGHETGLSCDLRLPTKGSTGAAAGGINVSMSNYDRDAARAVLKAFRSENLADLNGIYLNDDDLIQEGLCTEMPGHEDHIHVQIKPPARKDPV